MLELALHVLDIAENSSRAGASLVEITIVEDLQQDVFSLEIRDDGHGNTVIDVRPDGSSGSMTQQIVLEGVALGDLGGSDQEILNKLLGNGQLHVD